MSDLVHRQAGGGVEVKGPPGSRAPGVRVKPALRLALGYRDENRRGAPVKVDHFIAKKGPGGEYGRAADKFVEVYGENAKAIEIRLPAEFGQALDIRYKAFAGASGDEGGVMVAKGDTNFALYEWVGGPDTLTVWKQDGSVEEIQTAGCDAITGEPLDDVARDLGLSLYTTFRFGIPTVLGYGSFCEITTKGKVSTDTLWLKLRGWYSTFGPRTSWVVRPTLCVRPATARPVIKRDGVSQRIKTNIFVLDVVLTETEDDLLGRLREHAQLTTMVSGDLWSGGSENVLEAGAQVVDEDELDAGYVEEGPRPHASAPSSTGSGVTQTSPEPGTKKFSGLSDEVMADPERAARVTALEAELEAELGEPEVELAEVVEAVDALELDEQELARLPQALKRKPPFGSYQQYSLARIVESGPSGLEWLAYALRQEWPQDAGFQTDVQIVCKAIAPEVYLDWIDGGDMGSE